MYMDRVSAINIYYYYYYYYIQKLILVTINSAREQLTDPGNFDQDGEEALHGGSRHKNGKYGSVLI